MKFLRAILVLMVIMASLPASAQEDNPLDVLLSQVQDALEKDDLATAQALLPGAIALVDSVLQGCTSSPVVKNLLEKASTATDPVLVITLLGGASELNRVCKETEPILPPLGKTPEEVLPILGYAAGQLNSDIPARININLANSDSNYRWGLEPLPEGYLDFVLYSNITWNNQDEFCQIDFQSLGGEYYKLSLYQGNVELQYYREQNFVTSAWVMSPELPMSPGNSNDIILEVKDNFLTIYANGTELVTAPFRVIGSGAITLNGVTLATQTASNTSCTYNNTWVWQP